MDVIRAGAALAAVAVGCSSGTSRAVEDAKRPHASSEAPPPAEPAPAPEPRPAPTGDISVRVVWVGVPVAARTSPGKTACGTPRAPQVAPTTTWGIPEVLVTLDGASLPATGAAPEARVRYGGCAATPRLVRGTSLVVESEDDHPTRVVLREQGGGAARPIQLPIAGHSVSVPLTPGGVYELVAAKGITDGAWIVAGPGTITDGSGVATFRDVPPGTYAARAWLPARGGQPARQAQGEVTVGAGDLAELTLELR